MAYDLSILDRLKQRFRKRGTSLFIQTYNQDTGAILDSYEFTNVLSDAASPVELQFFAQQRLAAVAGVAVGEGFEPLLDTSWTRARNTANFNALVRDMDIGQTLRMPLGSYALDIIPEKSIIVAGAGRPGLNGSSLPIGGTTVVGQASIAGLVGACLRDFGVYQVGLDNASYPNGISAGMPGTSTADCSQIIERVLAVGRGAGANSQHGLLGQHGQNIIFRNVVAFNYLNNLVGRASRVQFHDSVSIDADGSGSAVLFKSAASGGANDAFDCLARNVRANAAAGKSASFVSLADDPTGGRRTTNAGFENCVAIGEGAGSIASFNMLISLNGCINLAPWASRCRSYSDMGNGAFLVEVEVNDARIESCIADAPSTFGYRSNATANPRAPRVIDCSSRAPGSSHVTGNFSFIRVNGSVNGL